MPAVSDITILEKMGDGDKKELILPSQVSDLDDSLVNSILIIGVNF